MTARHRFVIVWLSGLIAFVIAVSLHMPLSLASVPEGIVAHQTAGNAARVDYIQREWALAGVYESAMVAMIADFFFIILFGTGSLMAGLYYRSHGRGWLRTIGKVTAVAAVIFLASDLTETTMQIQQLRAGQGNDEMAALAKAMHYPKLVSWIICFILPLNGLVIDWSGSRQTGA